ncbi:MAG: SDR family NAD(P)-dependent oxidoreductase [Alphaproteobacteria bacterium]|nr:SDR family NAD(P)-dependent oxidoreductase [Alphaproteobacteria bacterium]
MANIPPDDPGKMAASRPAKRVVDRVLADVDGYVIAANKNCLTHRHRRASDAVDEACERFKAKGITVYMLPVSHAFHSAIVAPASDPLRGVLGKLGLQAPRRPITTNVTGGYYPSGEGAVDGIIDLLAQQISAPVEWTAQMERMYEDEGRVFVEVGPKRALAGFTVAILKRRPHRSVYTNHPKRGGVASFRDSLAQLLTLGVPLRAEPLASGDIDLFASSEPRRATSDAVRAFVETPVPAGEVAPAPGPVEPAADLRDGILRIVAKSTGYEIEELDLDFELEADLGIDTVKQAEVFSVVRDTYGIPTDPSFNFADHKTLRSLIDWAASHTGAQRVGVEAAPAPAPAPVSVPAPAAPAAAPIVSTEVVAEFLTRAASAGVQGLDGESFARALLPAVQGLLAAAFEAARASAPAPAPVAPAPVAAFATPASTVAHPAPAIRVRVPGALREVDATRHVVASGTSIGLPGGTSVFAEDNVEAILAGENRISPIGERAQQFLELGLVRLVKDPQTGQGSFLPVSRTDEVIRLAGTESSFDLTEWGVEPDLLSALDITTRLAFAAGLEALRDAGIPLVRSYKTTANGKRVPQGWMLPEALRDGTGVIFASAFPGYDQLVRHVQSGGRDAEGRFERRFLFQVLSMGHSQFAQFIGARGPNTAINAACASSTQAMSIAEDWIRMGRCDRVIVVGADDVTSEALLPWIGGGFMAAGAATTSDVVEEAALPFDRRRHGLLLGMGAVGVVLETPESCAERGVVPLAEQLAAVTVNSAFHGTRLDVDHIAGVVRQVVADVSEAEGTTPDQMARQTFFMSHETYTPARGGSAQAEIDALRAAFGPAAREVVVANTKGFTGHAMGAGIEDGVVLKALQYGRVPPIANLKEPDESLGDLTLSRGEHREFRYGLRLAAGFGSQLAVTVQKAVARGDDRLADRQRRLDWLRRVTGYAHPEEKLEARTLRVVDGAVDAVWTFAPPSAATSAPAPTPAPVAPAPMRTVPQAPRVVPTPPPDPDDDTRGLLATPASAPRRVVAPTVLHAVGAVSHAEVLAHLVSVVAEKTGYETDEIEPGFELEADLGIDTVKQAEILSDVMDHYALQRDDEFRISDHPTLEALAAWLVSRLGGAAAPEPVSVLEEEEDTLTPPEPPTREVLPPKGVATQVDVQFALREIIALVSARTGYGEDELEPSFELEADLGIDTVKQAEILSELQDRHGIERDESFQLSDYPTLEALAGWLAVRKAEGPGLRSDEEDLITPPPAPLAAVRNAIAADERSDHSEGSEPGSLSIDSAPYPSEERQIFHMHPTEMDEAAVLATLLGVVADKTGYDLSDLEPGFELEADLGVDTVKQAEILSDLMDRFSLSRDDSFSFAETRTLEDLAAYLYGRLATASMMPPPPREVAPPVDAPPVPAPTPVPSTTPPSAEDRPIVANHVALPPNFRLRRPVLRSAERVPGTPVAGRRIEVLGDGVLAERVTEILGERGAVLVTEGAELVVDCADDVALTFARTKALDGGERPKAWITVTRLGGLGEGEDSVARAYVDGARAGFTKSLGREWDVPSCVLDIHPATGPTDAAAVVADEAGCALEREVFVGEDGERSVVALVEEAPPAPKPLSGVFLLTGGGRGITATVAHELTRRGPVKLALVGRSAAPTSALDEKAVKERVRGELAAAGEKVTPAKVEAVLGPLRRAEELRQNLEALRRTGAEVVYLVADLADPDQVRRVVREATEALGPITAVVHGAGVEESRKLADKDETAFHRVFDGKAVGGRALFESVPSDAFVVSMGSVAGRFGNPGQVDYAAANDALARMCLARPHSLHVDWTAWDDVGMAVRGGMKTLLTDRGVDLLPAAAGACLVADLVAAGVTGELVCAGRLGDFEDKPDHPLLDVLEVDGGVARATRALSRRSDGWIADHAIDGVPVLPGVVGLELMVATAAALFPGRPFVGARNVRFNAPVKAYREEVTTLMLEAEPTQRPGEASARLISVRALKTGRTRRTEHFSATLIFGERPELEGLPSAFLPDEAIDREAIYARFFHGPIFQVLHQVHGVSADGLVAEGVADERGIAPSGLLTLPLVLEAAFQAAGLHRMIVLGAMGLPLEIEELVLYSVPADRDAGERVSLMVHHEDDVWNIDADGLGGPRMRVRGFRMVEKGPVPPDLRFEEPEEGRPLCFPPTQRRVSSASGPVAGTAHADEDPSPWLTEDELADLRARGTERRVRDRIAGRIAAKRALVALTGRPAHALRVVSAESGEPLVVGADARVSISHREGRAIALAVAGGRIGVDLERVEARPAAFEQTWFTAGERALCAGDPRRQTLVWAAKEAVSKWLGIGLTVPTTAIEIVSLGENEAQISLRGELAGRGEGLVVRFEDSGDEEIVVTARSAA